MVCAEIRFQDESVATIPATDVANVHGRPDLPPPVVLGPQQCAKTCSGIESREAKPINRAIAPNESSGVTVTDERVVLHSRRHSLFGARFEPDRRFSYAAIS